MSICEMRDSFFDETSADIIPCMFISHLILHLSFFYRYMDSRLANVHTAATSQVVFIICGVASLYLYVDEMRPVDILVAYFCYDLNALIFFESSTSILMKFVLIAHHTISLFLLSHIPFHLPGISTYYIIGLIGIESINPFLNMYEAAMLIPERKWMERHLITIMLIMVPFSRFVIPIFMINSIYQLHPNTFALMCEVLIFTLIFVISIGLVHKLIRGYYENT